MFKNIPIFIVLIFFLIGANGQSLISNSDFENITIVNNCIRYNEWESMQEGDCHSLYDTINNKPINGKFSLYINGDRVNLFETRLNKPLEIGKYYKLSFEFRDRSRKLPNFFTKKEISQKLGFIESDTSLVKNSTCLPMRFVVMNDYDGTQQSREIYFSPTREVNYIGFGNKEKISSYLPYILFSMHSYFACSFDDISITEVSKREYSEVTRITMNFKDSHKIETKNSEIHDFVNFLRKLHVKYPFQTEISSYYKNVYLAEKSLLVNDYESGLKYYTKAFSTSKPFNKDKSNAYKCLFTSLSKIDNVCVKHFFKVNFQSKTSASAFYDYLKNKNAVYDNDTLARFILEQDYVETESSIHDSILIKEINELGKSDQYLNRQVDYKELKRIDSSNLNKLLDIYAANREISERTVGTTGMNTIQLILFHCTRYNFNDWIEVIYRNVKKGNFSPEQFANLVDSYFQNNLSISSNNAKEYLRKVYISESYFSTYSKFLYFDLAEFPNFKDHQNLRMQIYLDSYEDEMKKRFYEFKNTGFSNAFDFKSSVEFGFSDNEAAKKFEKELIDEVVEYLGRSGLNILNLN